MGAFGIEGPCTADLPGHEFKKRIPPWTGFARIAGSSRPRDQNSIIGEALVA